MAKKSRCPPSRMGIGSRFRTPRLMLRMAIRNTTLEVPCAAASPEMFAMVSGPPMFLLEISPVSAATQAVTTLGFEDVEFAYPARRDQKVLRDPMLYLSLYFKTHRQYYYELLNRVRLQGDWEAWLDFFADAMTYGITLAVIGASLRVRAAAAFAKGLSLLAIGGWVFGSTVYRMLVHGTPDAEIMGLIGFLALLANVASVIILVRYKDGDANVRSVWLCSRNDAIGNVAVMIAALGVWGTATVWPDLIVALIMAGLFLWSAMQIIAQAWREWQSGIGPIHRHG